MGMDKDRIERRQGVSVFLLPPLFFHALPLSWGPQALVSVREREGRCFIQRASLLPFPFFPNELRPAGSAEVSIPLSPAQLKKEKEGKLFPFTPFQHSAVADEGKGKVGRIAMASPPPPSFPFFSLSSHSFLTRFRYQNRDLKQRIVRAVPKRTWRVSIAPYPLSFFFFCFRKTLPFSCTVVRNQGRRMRRLMQDRLPFPLFPLLASRSKEELDVWA